MIAYYAFVGFETLANVAEEMQNPARSYAPALFGSLLVAGLIYVGVGLVAGAAMPPAELAASTGPLLAVMEASGLGVPDFLDEWVSAPYPDQLKDRPIILKGLDDLGGRFLRADAAERAAKLAALPGSAFFKRMRALTVGAYYTTEAGFKDIGFIGNEARASDPGPSDAVKAVLERELKALGL